MKHIALKVDATGPENILSAGASLHLSARKCYRLKGLIIIIMEICKAPTMRLKALNKHNVTHIMYIEMNNGISNLTKN